MKYFRSSSSESIPIVTDSNRAKECVSERCKHYAEYVPFPGHSPGVGRDKSRAQARLLGDLRHTLSLPAMEY